MKSFPLSLLLSALLIPLALEAHSGHTMPNSGSANVQPPAAAPAYSRPSTIPFSSGRVVEVSLEISEEIRSPAGRPVRALTINGTVPGPTLRFKEGDTARIHVHNRLAKEETSLHWHGLLVPNDQDGVPHLTTPPIAAGTTFTYEFPLRQSGTYWFHSHTGLQEQRGVLGAIVVEPRHGELQHTDREQVLLLTDWSNESPDEILRTLKRGSNWYGIRKGTAQSISGAYAKGELSHYFQREKTRMPPMDISDIAYDAFLINGQRQFRIEGKPGETVRLRVINGSAATYFYLQSATGPVTIVAADGPPVEPTKVNRLLIGIAETYDLIVQTPKSGTWEIRATAQDGSGSAVATLGDGEFHPAPEVPKPDLYNHESMLKAAMEEADMPASGPESQPLRQGKQTKPPSSTGYEDPRPLPPYRQLRSVNPTTLPSDLPRRTVELHLTGDMQRYVWSFNGKTIDEESLIPVRRGEVLRLELVNDSMMHHPIHLHGHFFRLLNGQGAFSPLKHTVDVPPMGRKALEFEANEEGDWMFHCHILYHMMEGMARVLHYEQKPAAALSHNAGPAGAKGPHLGEHAMPMRYAFADFSVLSNFSEGSARILSGKNSLATPWEFGRRHSENRTEYETDLLYERYVDSNFGAFAGMRLSNQIQDGNRPLGGVWVRLPYLVRATTSLDANGAARMALSKDVQLTARLSVDLRARYDTRQRWEESITASYRLTKALALSAAFHTQYGLGAGMRFHF